VDREEEKQVAKKMMTKSELLANIAQECDLTRKQVAAVFVALAKNTKKGLKDSGMFVLPGLLKIEKKKIPARPARKGVPNPFKPGELMNVAAKPASTKVKVRALKALKDMA
jgi:nucleoid DNA-binding protein